MKKFSLAVGLLALLGTTAMAQQTTQSRPTSQPGVRGNSFTSGMTSGNSGAMTSSGMRDTTTGVNAGSGPERSSPEGSPVSGFTKGAATTRSATSRQSRFSEQPMVLEARKDLPANDLREFMALLKSNGSKMQFGSAGAGTTTHLACALLNSKIGVDEFRV